MGFTIARVCTLAAVLVMASAHDGNVPGNDEIWIPADDFASLPPPDTINATEATFTQPDGEIFYLDSGGSGDVILLMHPYTGSAFSWGYQFPAFTEAGFRVLALGMRGTYGTTAPFTSIQQAAEDGIALLDALGIEWAHVVGSAFGSQFAMRIAVSFPDRVDTVVLSCSPLAINEEAYLAQAASILGTEFEALPNQIKELGPSYRYANPDGVALWQEIGLGSAAASGIFPTAPGLPTPNFQQLQEYTGPVALMGGGADLYAPPAMTRLVHEQIPQSTLIFFNEVAHTAFWENPFRFNDAVLYFIEHQGTR